jgi:hypothetical protein
MFNGEHYLQISGTTMGTKMAPSYANIFTGRLEHGLLHCSPTDDIEMKWVDGRESRNNFIEMANSFHNSIKFTVEISTSKYTFLDTTSTLTKGEIEFNLHTKSTDSHLYMYLMPSGCDPPHTFKGVPKGLATRIHRISSFPASLQVQGKILKNILPTQDTILAKCRSQLRRWHNRTDSLFSNAEKGHIAIGFHW